MVLLLENFVNFLARHLLLLKGGKQQSCHFSPIFFGHTATTITGNETFKCIVMKISTIRLQNRNMCAVFVIFIIILRHHETIRQQMEN